MKRALQTRMLGYTTDSTGHVMAPPEVVYEVEPQRRQRTTFGQKVLGLGVLAACIYAAVQSIVFILTGVVIGI